jgi:putative nicotinate phosphoribosyltransferase
MSTALFTDRYELTMLEAALTSGIVEHHSVFEVFARALPSGRRYGIVAGLGRLVEELAAFRFDDAALAALERAGVVGAPTLEWLARFRFGGAIDAYAEGESYFPGSPVCAVRGRFGECLLLETLALSILNFDTAVASAAARMVVASAGRPLIEMGSRRVHERAAVAAARAAYLAGFASTSNLAAGARYSIPTAGTASHAFTLAYLDEAEAFRAQIATAGVMTSLLVDTYDIPGGIEAAVAAARTAGASGPGAIRIDSGILAEEAVRARKLLDELGATATRIVVSSDLDEFALAELQGAPINAYGVGTSVATGSGAPTAGFVYKLVAIADGPGADAPLRSVAKRSVDKETIGGRKHPYRVYGPDGRAVCELLSIDEGDGRDVPPHARRLAGEGARWRRLQEPAVRDGEPLIQPSLDESRTRVAAAIAELDPSALALDAGPPALSAELAGVD